MINILSLLVLIHKFEIFSAEDLSAYMKSFL
jgi:hypothetical protein